MKRKKSWEPTVLPSALKKKQNIERIISKKSDKNKRKRQKIKKEQIKLFSEQQKINKNIDVYSSNIKALRKREGRPEFYNKLSSISEWQKNPGLQLQASAEVSKLYKYYKSPEVQKQIKDIKLFNPSFVSPTEGRDFEIISLAYESKGIGLKNTKSGKWELQNAIRHFLSRKVSIPEFEQRVKTEYDTRKMVKGLYDVSKASSRYNFEEYEQAFYRVMREAISKSKNSYDSESIVTLMYTEGIDSVLDERGNYDERLLEAIDDRITDDIAEIELRRAELFGRLEKSKPMSSDKVRKVMSISSERRDIVFNPNTNWFDDLTQEESRYLLKNDFKNSEMSKISEKFPTVKELQNAQNIISKANKIEKGKVLPKSVETYNMVSDIMKSYNSNDVYTMADALWNLYKSNKQEERTKDFIEVYNLLHGGGNSL